MSKSWCESILGLIVLVFALWQTAYSQWIIVISAIIMIIHSFTCKKCFAHGNMSSKTGRRK
jgi:hypothetical protein